MGRAPQACFLIALHIVGLQFPRFLANCGSHLVFVHRRIFPPHHRRNSTKWNTVPISGHFHVTFQQLRCCIFPQGFITRVRSNKERQFQCQHFESKLLGRDSFSDFAIRMAVSPKCSHPWLLRHLGKKFKCKKIGIEANKIGTRAIWKDTTPITLVTFLWTEPVGSWKEWKLHDTLK